MSAEETTTGVLARVMGLDRALAEYPEDVAAAVQRAAAIRDVMPAVRSPAAEPHPPMQVGTPR